MTGGPAVRTMLIFCSVDSNGLQKLQSDVTDFVLHAQAVKRALSIPVLANGNVRNLADAEACLAYTGALSGIVLQSGAGRSGTVGALAQAGTDGT